MSNNGVSADPPEGSADAIYQTIRAAQRVQMNP